MSLLVVANWKMYGDALSFSSFVEGLSGLLSDTRVCDFEVVLCPPFTALSGLVSGVPSIKFGGQNCFYEIEGRYTGEISPQMLYSCGCNYVIVGHSERRNVFRESDSDVQLKASSAIKSGLIPIVCVGETLIDRQNNMLKDALLNQCCNSFPKNGKFVIAYEPVWAIGSNKIPSVDMIVEALDIIRLCNSTSSIIYGGAVNCNNVVEVMSIDQLSGVLVGSASLELSGFYNIIRGAINVRRN
ncbi:MAG: triosephosphate isomerase [Ehrlichia sp.]